MEMISSPIIFDRDLKFSETEMLNVEAVKQAVEQTNEVFFNATTALDDKEKYPINLILEIEKSALGGSLITKTLTKFIEENQNVLMANPIEGNYPDMISRSNALTGVELKSKWLGGSGSFTVYSTRKTSNNILAFGWDFIDIIPQIVVVFFTNQLAADDWNIYEGKSETIGKRPSGHLNKQGTTKLKDGWLLMHPLYDFPNW